MNDKELLTLAAKAYWGDEINDVCSVRWLDTDEAIGYMHGDNQDHNGRDVELVWNPLEFDYDAFRLMVVCKLHIGMESHTVSAWHKDRFGHFFTEAFGDGDHCEATRRAIVRAAAAIGKDMP